MGSVRQLTSLSGAVTDTYSYDAFGNLLASTGSTPNNFLYRGEQYDSALGLEYLRARYYNPATGRFLSKDPWGGSLDDPATLHKYSYAHSNPIAGRDPSGWLDAGEQIEGDRISLETERGIKNASKAVDCLFQTQAQLLTAVYFHNEDPGTLINIVIEAALCTADALEGPGKQGTGPPEEPQPEEPGTGGCCFAAGTPVHTDHGDVPVESINVDDEVLSRNSATGKIEYRRVTALTPKHKDTLVDLRVEGEAPMLRPSTDHPFWVKRGDRSDGAWIAAGKMRVGDLLQTTTGDWKRIVAITPEKKSHTVYNFTVDEYHDYFVGETGFLVHNAGGCGCEPFPQDVFSSKAPYQVTPGLRTLEGQYLNGSRWEPWKAFYDQFGRLIGRTDYNAGNTAAEPPIPDTHYHTYEWGPGKNPRPTGQHIPGKFPCP